MFTMNTGTNQTDTHQLLDGIHVTVTNGRWAVYATSIDALRTAFGEPLLNAFVRGMGVLDRLHTILDLFRLNDQDWVRTRGRGAESVQHERNRYVLVFFSCGLIHECREGIRQLEEAGIVARLSARGRERWASGHCELERR
jgi:hypothetical protein